MPDFATVPNTTEVQEIESSDYYEYLAQHIPSELIRWIKSPECPPTEKIKALRVFLQYAPNVREDPDSFALVLGELFFCHARHECKACRDFLRVVRAAQGLA